MSRRIVIGLTMIAAMVVATPAIAVAVRPGSSMLAIQFSNGMADFAGPEDGTGYISAYDHTEWGVQGQFWKMMGTDYAFWLSGGAGWFSEINEPGDNAFPGSTDFEYTQKSWNVRIGGDRVVNIGERGAVYFGPGLEYWSGSAELNFPPVIETPTTTRISLIGRIGGLMTIGESWGFTGHVGWRAGQASAEEAGAKATWWPSGFDGAGGLVFTFGGTE